MEDVKLSYATVNDRLYEWFPILRSAKYLQWTGGFDGLNPYVIFGSIVRHYIADILDEGDIKAQAKIAQFLELMATAGDLTINELLEIEVWPTCLTSQKMIDAYWENFGIATRRRLHFLAPRLAPHINLPPLSGC